MYRVGILQFPDDDDDERCDDYSEAVGRAVYDSFDDGIHAIWNEASHELEAIVYRQEVFEK